MQLISSEICSCKMHKHCYSLHVASRFVYFCGWTIGGRNQPMMTMPWLRHRMETFSALQAICAGNSPVSGEFPAQRPVTWSFHVFFDLRPNKPLSKQSRGWWFETLSPPLWRHCNAPIWNGRCWNWSHNVHCVHLHVYIVGYRSAVR